MTLDYNKIYLERYKSIPNYIFWGTLISMLLEIFIAGIALMPYGFLIWIFAPGIAVLCSFFNRWLASLLISQRIVVADSLLSLVNKAETQKSESYTQTATPIAVQEELPELPEL